MSIFISNCRIERHGLWRYFIGPLATMMAILTPAAAEPYQVAVLQGLDKVTARVWSIDAPIGQTVRFGTLEIQARICEKRSPEEPPESAAFLEIRELRQGVAPLNLFRGWMFASTPALSAIEHPVYDVWVIDCRNASSSR